MHILILENGYEDLIKSRLPLGEFLESKGHKVSYGCPNPRKSSIYNLPMNRSRFSIITFKYSLSKIFSIEKEESIDIVLSFRLYPNLLNYFSSFINPNIRRVSVITGLGIAFASRELKYLLTSSIIRLFYKISSKRILIICQNKDDPKTLNIHNNCEVIPGSGVRSPRLNQSKLEKKRNSKVINLLYVGRLLKSKGINEVLEIFKILQQTSNNYKLLIVGDIDSNNSDSIDKSNLDFIKNNPLIEYLGFVENLSPIYLKSHVLLFPSRYREGVPRVIIESLSYGLTIVTSNMPGCKDGVMNNGVLIKNDINDAVEYIKELTYDQILTNSKNSLSLFKRKFSSEKIYPHFESVLEKVFKT